MIENQGERLSPRLRQDLYARVSDTKTRLRWSGIALAIVGALALLFPVVGTLSVEILVGWSLFLAGVITAFGAFQLRETSPFVVQLMIGLLNAALGFFLLLHPGVGAIALTILLAVAFVVDGVWQIGLAYEMRPRDGWGWFAASGAVAIVAGFVIAAGLPGSSLVVIGLLLGINFMTTGFALLLLSSKLDPAEITRQAK